MRSAPFSAGRVVDDLAGFDQRRIPNAPEFTAGEPVARLRSCCPCKRRRAACWPG